MKLVKSYLLSFFLLLIITSCTKVIDLKLGNNAGDLVIEGNIIDERGPQTITLSLNVPFTNTNTYPPVTGATVSVSDTAGHNYNFIEGPQGTYSINDVKGISGRTYTMKVVTNGKTYTATSKMPEVVLLDSITSEEDNFSNKNFRKKISVYYQDPKGVPNQYNFLMFVNGVQVKNIFTNNDQFTDGRYVSLDLIEDDIDIYPGDVVKIEMQCVDPTVYTYWFTLSQQAFNGPGGSVTPSNPPNNITPSVLGYFSAHTTQTETITVSN